MPIEVTVFYHSSSIWSATVKNGIIHFKENMNDLPIRHPIPGKILRPCSCGCVDAVNCWGLSEALVRLRSRLLLRHLRWLRIWMKRRFWRLRIGRRFWLIGFVGLSRDSGYTVSTIASTAVLRLCGSSFHPPITRANSGSFTPNACESNCERRHRPHLQVHCPSTPCIFLPERSIPATPWQEEAKSSLNLS